MKQNAITLYLPQIDEDLIEQASKEVSLPKSAFCRTSAIQSAKQILKQKMEDSE